MRTVLAVAALSLCLAFASHAAERLSVPTQQDSSCIGHSVTRTAYNAVGVDSLGCAQYLSTHRIVQARHSQRT